MKPVVIRETPPIRVGSVGHFVGRVTVRRCEGYSLYGEGD